MKTSIVTIASSIALMFSLTSCKEDHTELIQKIETTQLELQQQDSILTIQRNELSTLVFTDTVKKENVNPDDNLLTNLVSKQNTLITRIELIIQKNKELITKLNDNSAAEDEVNKEYLAITNEIELMKPETNAAKDSYNKLVEEIEQAFKSLEDSTKAK